MHNVMNNHQRGATLIEVMVSVLIVAFGALAMIALQTNAVKFNKTNEYRSLATLLANDLADRMRVNTAGVVAGSYTLNAAYSEPAQGVIPPRTECTLPDNCTAPDLARRDLSEWQRALFFSLPGGTGFVQPTANSQAADIWVAWTDPAGANPLQGANNGCPAAFRAPNTVHCVYFRVAIQ